MDGNAEAVPAIGSHHEELAELVARHARTEGTTSTPIGGLSLVRLSAETEAAFCFYEPALIVVAQGKKVALLSSERYVYDPTRYLLTAVNLPVMSRVVEATPERPYLGIMIRFDVARFADVVATMTEPVRGPLEIERAICSQTISAALLDAIVRLVRLLDAPSDIAALAPLFEREIVYRLLVGPAASRVFPRLASDGPGRHVSAAVDWLNINYARPLRIAALARSVNMSASSLHHHFKTLTSMSPLQYQKRLRLQAARHMMLESRDVGTVSRRVGYDSPSQFSREYRRLYGQSPLRDIARLRSSLTSLDA